MKEIILNNQFYKDCIFTDCLLVVTLICITISMELISLVFYTNNRKNLRYENDKLKKENEALKKLL